MVPIQTFSQTALTFPVKSSEVKVIGSQGLHTDNLLQQKIIYVNRKHKL